MPSFSAAFEAEDKAHREYERYYAKQEDLGKTKSDEANEQRELHGDAQEACSDGAAALMAAPVGSKGKRKYDQIDQTYRKYPPAVERLSQISNLRKVFEIDFPENHLNTPSGRRLSLET
jgi:hypothetical protein